MRPRYTFHSFLPRLYIQSSFRPVFQLVHCPLSLSLSLSHSLLRGTLPFFVLLSWIVIRTGCVIKTVIRAIRATYSNLRKDNGHSADCEFQSSSGWMEKLQLERWALTRMGYLCFAWLQSRILDTLLRRCGSGMRVACFRKLIRHRPRCSSPLPSFRSVSFYLCFIIAVELTGDFEPDYITFIHRTEDLYHPVPFLGNVSPFIIDN